MANKIIEKYDKEAYLEWHDTEVERDVGFEQFVENFRQNLKTKSRENLTTLGQLLTQIKSITEPECKLQSNGMLSGEFELPTKQFSGKEASEEYDLLFKPVDSIIEKSWRKNSKRTSKYVSSENLENEITDVIRTSVICPTLNHAKMFTDRFKAWNTFIKKSEIEEYFSQIAEIEVDKEAKLAEGYFAYHALVHFNEGVPIEVQFYSQLSSAWRNMSHKLYEATRVGSSPFFVPGSPESRLISLGHLLHLAEYELERLATDLKEKL